MLVCQSLSHLTENMIDVQFADKTSTIEGLILKILHGLPQHKNQVQAGVFIARVDEGIPRVVGLPLSERKLGGRATCQHALVSRQLTAS